jgi:methylthioribose-1-phosphate isomerase
MSQQSRQIAGLFQKLSSESQQTLLDFAEFLLHRETQNTESNDAGDEPRQKHEPLHQPRPQNENIINAIKRMRATYFMLNTDELLNETSSLMTQHIVHGRAANDVINELETLFESHYQKYLQP